VTAIRRLAATGSLVLLAAGGFLVASAGPANAHVSPIVECVFHDTGTGQYNALWGYDNPSSSTATLPIGGANNFAPNPADRGQGTAFAAGRHDNAFVANWNGAGNLAWNLDTLNAHATASSPACGTNPVPIAGSDRLTWILLTAAFIGAAAVVARHTRHDPARTTRTT